MGTSNYSDEFKRDAVQQITVRGYPVREVARRLGVGSHSLCKWLKLFGEPTSKSVCLASLASSAHQAMLDLYQAPLLIFVRIRTKMR
jgi:transposase-like protein